MFSAITQRLLWIGCAALMAFVCGLPSLALAANTGNLLHAPVVDNSENIASLVFGLFMGVMLTGAAYLFFIWIVIRDRGQFFLLLLLLCLSVNIASTNDLFMAQLHIDRTTMRELLFNYSLICACLFSIIFSYYFLEVDVNSPGFTMPMYVLGVLLVAVLFYSSYDQSLAHLILPMVSLLTAALILSAGLLCLLRGVSGSFTHIIAFGFFLVGTLVRPAYTFGLIQTSEASTNLTDFSFAAAALMFAIVIASQFAARQEEKEKALALSNERFTLATRGANEGLFDWTLTTGSVFFSEQFRKIIDLRLDNSPKGIKTWLRLMLPSDRRIVREALRRFRRNKNVNTINIEYRIVNAHQEKLWLHTKAIAVRDPRTSRVLRLVGSTNDITSRKQSEVALRASETRFRSITEAHPVPVLIVGLQSGHILYASPGAEQLLGVSQERILHEDFSRFLSDAKARLDLFQDMNRGKEINLQEVSLHRADHMPLATALSARRISYQNEDAVVIGLYDLTERKKAEAQIAHQQEALQQSEKMAALGGLLAGVAHELNNPLSVVVGQASLLMDGAGETKVGNRAEKIFKAADRCSRIVKSFLALARRKPPERKNVLLNPIIHASLELLGYQLRTSDVAVTLELASDLPPVMGDDDQLTQVVTNLILNATQALEGWKGRREVTIRTFVESNHAVALDVVDTGPGIPADIRKRVFEPFFTTKSDKGGTGVGLSLCLNIVASHGGVLTLEDTQGSGATFHVRLPIADATRSNAPDNASAPESSLRKLRILLVDDELDLAQTLADLLEPEGHEVDIAVNGSIALEKLRKTPFDIIISDLRMPVLDGPGLYEALKQEMPDYTRKILYVTGDTLSRHVQRFLKENPVPVIEKPYRFKDVRTAIAALLKDEGNKGSMASSDS